MLRLGSENVFREERFMVRMTVEYGGGLRCEAVHGPSGQRLTTDAPVDNHGRGESFSPTDLLATALATCMATIMGIIADRHAVDLTGMRIDVEKEMVVSPVRRVGRLTTRIEMPLAGDHAQRVAFEQCVRTCPVYASLHPEIEKVVDFVWR